MFQQTYQSPSRIRLELTRALPRAWLEAAGTQQDPIRSSQASASDLPGSCLAECRRLPRTLRTIHWESGITQWSSPILRGFARTSSGPRRNANESISSMCQILQRFCQDPAGNTSGSRQNPIRNRSSTNKKTIKHVSRICQQHDRESSTFCQESIKDCSRFATYTIIILSGTRQEPATILSRTCQESDKILSGLPSGPSRASKAPSRNLAGEL